MKEHPHQAKQKILITGANGQLGYNLCIFFQSNGIEVIGSSRSTPLHSHHDSWISLDLSSDNFENQLYQLPSDLDAIIHCAAFTDVTASEKETELCYQVNVQASDAICSCARRLNVPLIYLSTDFVFEGNLGNYHEQSPTFPKGVYSKTKLFAEREVLKYIKGFVLRFTPLDHPYLLSHHKGGFVKMIQRAHASHSILRLFTNKTLSPVSSMEIFEACKKILKDGNFPRISHIASSEAVSVYELGKLIQSHLKLNLLIEASRWPDNDYSRIRPQYSHLISNHYPTKGLNEILLGISNPAFH